MITTNKLAEHIKKFDAYPKTLEDFRIKTFSGAAVTLVSAVIITLLFISELNYYLTPEVTEELFVDVSRNEKLRINFDVTFPKISCKFLSIDAMDVSGEQQINLDHNIYKRRLDEHGKPLEKPEKEKVGTDKVVNGTLMPTLDPNRCESCYGADIPPKNCCNTCSEVQNAYRMKSWAVPDLDTFEQCRREGWTKLLEPVDKESCQVFGYLDVNRVAGNFHIAPGRTFTQNHVHVRLAALHVALLFFFFLKDVTVIFKGKITSGFSGLRKMSYSQNVHDLQPAGAAQFNLTHKIRHLSFGRNIPGKTNPLDGTELVATRGAMTFQYYVKIVPTMYARADGQTLHTNQFAVTRHQKQASSLFGDQGPPGVFVFYELAPLMVKYGEKEKSFFHFLTSVCAIVGGVFTVSGMIDSAIYHSSKVFHKIELGKVS